MFESSLDYIKFCGIAWATEYQSVLPSPRKQKKGEGRGKWVRQMCRSGRGCVELGLVKCDQGQRKGSIKLRGPRGCVYAGGGGIG